MARRKPPEGLTPPDRLADPESGWRRYQCTLVTPMYGGGVTAGEVDRQMPIRATAIRGQLRFWWRLLNRNRFLTSEGKPDSEALFKAEREIWGGLGGEEALRASKVILRVVCKAAAEDLLIGSTAQSDNAVRYAFGAAANNGPTKWLKAGYEFSLHISSTKEIEQGVETAVRWWACFGGLGARTRRGLGALSVDEIVAGRKEAIPPVTQEEAEAAGMHLVLQNGSQKSAETAWKAAVGRLRAFRQEPGIGRKPKTEGNTDGLSPGRSHWPEPDAIRRITGRWFGKRAKMAHEVKNKATGRYVTVGQPHDHAPQHLAGNVFPRAAFGLPIIFHFKDANKGEPADVHLVPSGGPDRLASPLILHPYRTADGWKAAALCLPAKHVWNMGIKFKDRDECFAPGEWWSNDEQARKSLAKTVPPILGTGCSDPLTAFLTFFKTRA